MQKNNSTILFLLFSLLINLNAQFKLVDEKLQGKNYQLTIEAGPVKYQIINAQNSKQLFFEEYTDES